MTNFEMVREFHEKFGCPISVSPELPSRETRELRLSLIKEEVEELHEGETKDDIVAVADALTDILYVVYGMGHVYGIDLDGCFREVHRSNMSKLGSDGCPVYREDGKVLKGPFYSKPDLRSVLEGKENGAT